MSSYKDLPVDYNQQGTEANTGSINNALTDREGK